MKPYILKSFEFNLVYLQGLLNGVPDDKLASNPPGQTNHPAWVVGHLAAACDFFGGLIGAQPVCPKEWEPLFGWSAKPIDDLSRYPKRDVLLKAVADGHAAVAAAFEKATDAQLAATNPVEQMARMFPTVGDAVVFGMTSHESTHLGQLSAWRRAMGYPSVF